MDRYSGLIADVLSKQIFIIYFKKRKWIDKVILQISKQVKAFMNNGLSFLSLSLSLACLC